MHDRGRKGRLLKWACVVLGASHSARIEQIDIRIDRLDGRYLNLGLWNPMVR